MRLKKKKTREKIGIDTKEWLNKTPEDIKGNLNIIVNSIIDDSEMSSEKQAEVVQAVHTLIPEYPYFHWRKLNTKIHRVSKNEYENANYLSAAREAVKEYENEVKSIAGISDFGWKLMDKAFGKCPKPINVTPCITSTHKNIEKGQRDLSTGVISGFRNPVSHESDIDTYPHIFDDQDSLDILSLISYLFNRLERRSKPPIT